MAATRSKEISRQRSRRGIARLDSQIFPPQVLISIGARQPKTRYRKLAALGVKAERARKATATGRGAWWNAGASHMHAAITNRVLAQRGLLSLLDQIPVRSRLS